MPNSKHSSKHQKAGFQKHLKNKSTPTQDVPKDSLKKNEDLSKKESLEGELKAKVLGLEKVITDLNDKLLRSLAESDNLRRRAKEEVEKANKYAISNFASQLVLVAENFYLAVENMPKEEIDKNNAIKNFADAVVMTKKELAKILEQNGIKRVSPLGEQFDHNYHEAIAHVEGQGESGKVSKVIQSGYSINNRLIRPALVEVNK